MNEQGWIKRAVGTRGLPAGLGMNQMVEFRVGDDPMVHADEAGQLAWGDGPGAIAEYRPLVPAGVGLNRKHAHYFKPVGGLTDVDVYRVLELFGVTDQALGHAIKKLLVAGGRGAGKDIRQDVQEAIDTLQRWQEMRHEDAALRRA